MQTGNDEEEMKEAEEENEKEEEEEDARGGEEEERSGFSGGRARARADVVSTFPINNEIISSEIRRVMSAIKIDPRGADTHR